MLPKYYSYTTKVMNMAKFRKISVSEEVYLYIQQNKGKRSVSEFLLTELVGKVTFEKRLAENYCGAKFYYQINKLVLTAVLRNNLRPFTRQTETVQSQPPPLTTRVSTHFC